MNRATITAEQRQSERKAKRFYTGLVLLLFAIQTTILGTALKLAIGDPSLTVVPRYHQAALDWDKTHAARTAINRKGWDVQMNISDVADASGKRAMELKILDASGKAIDDLQIDGRVYHHARADKVDTVSLKSIGEGRYLSLSPMAQTGTWQVELEVHNADEPINLIRVVELKS